MIDFQSVTKKYPGHGRQVRALDQVSFNIKKGEFAAVHGHSGSGKSTLLLIAGGLLQPTQGDVRIAGVDPYTLRANHRASFRAKKLGFVFQQFHLVPYLNVLDNVISPTFIRPDRNARARASSLLEQLNLGHRLHHRPSELSVGERQRVALARAVIRRPALILADEPTGNLDADNAGIVISFLWDYVTHCEGTVLVVSHDQHVIDSAGHKLELRDGELVTPLHTENEPTASTPSQPSIDLIPRVTRQEQQVS